MENTIFNSNTEENEIPAYSRHCRNDLLGYNTPYGEFEGRKFYLNPRRNSSVLKCLRAFVKAIRIFYVCVIYYFMPFIFVFITFLTSVPIL